MPEEKTLCVVCSSPSAIFHVVEGRGMVRLAKTMTRVTGRNSPAVYVHDNPCKATLVQNWAKYVADSMAKNGLEKLAEGCTNGQPNETYLQDP